MSASNPPALVEVVLVTKDGLEYPTLAFKRPSTDVTLPGHAIVGRLRFSAGVPDWASFSPNRPFLELFARYMKGHEHLVPEVLERAQVNAGEYVYVLDRRSATAGGDVPFSDIIGWYRSRDDGRPEPESFEYNPDHKIVLADGTFSSILSDTRVHRVVLHVAHEGMTAGRG